MNIHYLKKNKYKIIFGSTLLLVFSLGFVLGQMWMVRKTITGKDGSVEISKVLDLYSKTRSSEVSFEQFWRVWDEVKKKHVEQPVDEVKLFYGAIEGMVNSLEDPYSVYFPPKKAEEFTKDMSGEFDGIGAEIGIKDKMLVIIAPLPGSPAEKAGLKAGDKILTIDTKDTRDMTVEEAVNLIRGKKGTEVLLSILKDGQNLPNDYKIQRDTINVPTVDLEMKENNIAYLRISYFNDNTWGEFDKAVKNILVKKPKGIILDMRSNPGGYLQTSVDVASEWIKSGVIVKEKFNNNKTNKYQSTGEHRLVNIKTVILVDEGTASGAEIVAGALQDYGVAKLIGNKTYGKGSVQDFEPLPDGSALKLTVAKWFTPNERQINKMGIEPDIKIEEMFVKKDPKSDGKNPDDYIDKGLEKAIEVIKL